MWIPPVIKIGIAVAIAANKVEFKDRRVQSLCQTKRSTPMAMPMAGKKQSDHRMFSVFHVTFGIGSLE